jgi:hypothetical protein
VQKSVSKSKAKSQAKSKSGRSPTGRAFLSQGVLCFPTKTLSVPIPNAKSKSRAKANHPPKKANYPQQTQLTIFQSIQHKHD